MTSAKPHNYEAHVITATCENGGKTVHLCEGCGSSFVTDYTNALGHKFNKGTPVSNPSCNGEGVTEFRCERCGYHYLEGESAKGHTPDHEATCTEPSTCTSCGAVLKPATGHKASDWIIDKEPTTENEGSRHKECENCGEKLETESIPKLYLTATTDSHGEAVVGGYLVIVTDTDTKNPVANASVALNKDGSISIRLPNSRLIDYADQTTVQVKLVKDKSPVSNLLIAVTDKNSNYAAGVTDKAGQITVPGTSGKTNGDGNATVGFEDKDGNRFKTVDEMAAQYGFTQQQKDYLADLLADENNQLWSAVLYGIGYSDDQIVTVALSQIGNYGGAPYWSWYGFGSRVEWCACFVSWCANECGYIDNGIIPKFAGCILGVQWFRDRGQWMDNSAEPLPGMIIFFDWDNPNGSSGPQDGLADHVGIVEKVENGVVYTVEGNSGDSVRINSYPLGYYEILGYGVPQY